MPSAIDVTKPQAGEAFTDDVRANFATAAGEITTLQDAVAAPATAGTSSIGSGAVVAHWTVGQGVPGGATPGFDAIGSLYIDANGTKGSALYLSGGDGTWTVLS
jgi:hypothetical protein